jgi:hypothetical protein
MGGDMAVWPLLVFGGLLTTIAAGIFVAIYLSARAEDRDQRSR